MSSVLFIATYIVLWILTVGLSCTVFALYRHLGLQMLNGAEGRARQGPDEGSRLPDATLHTLSGATMRLNQPRERPLFVFFASTTCEPCRRTLEALGQFARRYDGALDTVLVCRGDTTQEVQEFTLPLPECVYVVPDTRWELGARLRVSSTPFGLIADEESIVRAKGMPDRAEHFAWFIEQLEVASGRRQRSVELDPLPMTK